MNKLHFKQRLLSGTAIVAISAVVSMGMTSKADALTVTADTTYASVADTDIVLNADGLTLLVTNNINDVGNVTDTSTAQDGAISILGAGQNEIHTFLSINVGGNVVLTGTDAMFTRVVNDGILTVGGNLLIDDLLTTTAADAATWTQTGNATIAGTTIINAGKTNAVATTVLTLNGNNNVFTGLVTLNGGANNAANDASIDLNGTAVTFTAGLVLNDFATGSTAGDGVLNISGAAAQTVTGVVNGNSEGEGTIIVNNTGSAAVTFASAIGGTQGIALMTITDAGSSTIFNENVTVSGIAAGAAAVFTIADAQAVTFLKSVDLVDSGLDAAGTGIMTVGNASTILFSGTIAQTFDGDIAGLADNDGVLSVTNTAGLTITGDAGTGGNDLETVTLSGVGAKLTVTTGLTGLTTAGDGLSTNGQVHGASAGTRGGILVITTGAGSSAANTASTTNVSLIGGAGANTLTALTVSSGAGGAGFTTGTGGASGTSALTLTGASDVSTINVTAGTSGAGVDNVVAGIGGASGTATLVATAALTSATVNVTGGSAAAAGTALSADSGAAGVGGLVVLDLNVAVGTTQTATALNITGGAGGQGGNATGAFTGANGAVGGAATVQLLGDLTSTVTLDDGTTGAVGTSATGGTGGSAGLGGAATLTFDGTADHTVTGSILAAADGEGAISLNNTDAGAANDVTISGDVGSSTAALKSITTTAGDVTFTGNVFAKSIIGADAHVHDFNGDVTAATALTLAQTATFAGDVTATTLFNINTTASGITFDGTTAQTITGALTNTSGTDASATADLDVTNTGGIVTFKNSIGASGANLAFGDITLAASTTTVFDSTIDATVLDASGIATFNAAVTVDSTVVLGNNSTINIGDGFASGATIIAAAGAMTDGANITVVMPSDIISGQNLIVVSAGSGINGTYTATNTAMFTYVTTLTGDTVATITATERSSSSMATTLGTSSQEAATFSSANTALNAGGDAVALAAFNTALNAGGSTARIAAETMGTQADSLGASSAAAMSTGGTVSGIASNRLASMRSNVGEQYAAAGQDTGFNTGSGALSKNFWMKGFGTWADQDESGGIKGYSADTQGVSAGFDMAVSQNYRLGASIGISNTDVDGDGSGKSKDEISSNQFTVYGDYTTSSYFLEGSLGYAMNTADKSRNITIGTLSRVATADDVDSDQFMVNVSAGMPMSLGGSTVFTPRAGMSYTLLSTDNYTEGGAGNLNQTVSSDDQSAFILSFGGKVHTKVKTNNGNFVPSFHAGVSYDVSGDEAVSQSTFTSGGAAVTTTGAEQEQLAGNFGAGLAYEVDEASVGFNYDLSMKDGYSAHSGMLEAKFKF